jgi:surface polysaccharide O-acyltransferase-like enzyme
VGLVLLPLAVLAALRVVLAGRFPSTHALVGDWFNHVQYGGLFLLGATLARAPAVWARMETQRWFALAVAFAGWAVLTGLSARHGVPGQAAPEIAAAMRIAFATAQWCAVVALVGFAHRHLDRDHPSRRYLTDAVFPVYILHQTLIVLLADALRPLAWPPALEGPLLAVATLALSFAGYEAVRRVPLLRPWFGLRSGGRAAPASASASAPARAPASPPAPVATPTPPRPRADASKRRIAPGAAPTRVP